ncbi:unnamed protein product [Chondrus crispus]|uniref:Uncharacterized protein n=1 Tax=Chondrus crispus TaxID=2769 RepID=R7Q759_CHOCR|nr:unnamed protein product [Chondrus crispus]CDF33658.1 unnamed protein product [Chondrus crispus]|eukprot:XP_005713477.1 unnamed protein product [Chondrus crispus]
MRWAKSQAFLPTGNPTLHNCDTSPLQSCIYKHLSPYQRSPRLHRSHNFASTLTTEEPPPIQFRNRTPTAYHLQ